MVRKITLFIFGILLTTQCFASSRTTTLNYIVAKVNDQIITYTQLQQRAKQFEAQLRDEKIKLPSRKLFLNQVLQTMVNEQLQLQIAQRSGISVTAYDVQRALEVIAKQQKLSTKQLIARANKVGISYKDYLQTLRTQLIVQKVQQAMVVSRIHISPEEIDSYLRTATNSAQGLNLYHVEDILVGVSDAPTPYELEAAREKAEDIKMQAEAGTSFKTLAVAQSSGQQALQGGDLGWRSLAELPAVFAKRVMQMKSGDIAGPIQAPNGYHIIHLIGVKRNPKAPSNKAMENQISQMLYRQKLEENLQQWIEQLRAQSYVKLYL